jgi:VanZ family protein/glutaredoxin
LIRLLRLGALWVPVVAYGGVVYYLSSLPQVAIAGRFPDYLTHPVEYAGLMVLIVRALNGGLDRVVSWPVYFVSAGLAILYAISDEIHQLHVPRRTASLKDVCSDALGAVLAMGLLEVVQRVRLRPPPCFVKVTLYTRRECHLCHQARAILERLSREAPLEIAEVDVDTRPDLAARFGGEVPVIVAEGRKISKLRPDEEAIRRRLLRIVSEGRPDGVASGSAFG